MTLSVAIDVMGGRGGVSANIAAMNAVVEAEGLILVGDRELIEKQPDIATLLARGARIEHAADWLTGEESLNEVLRDRPQASMAVCARLVKSADAGGMVSSGDTRALMALTRRYLGTLPGLQRPAIAKSFTGDHGPFWMLDLGANIECSAELLVQFAKLGQTIAALSDKTVTPRVALLNIGT